MKGEEEGIGMAGTEGEVSLCVLLLLLLLFLKSNAAAPTQKRRTRKKEGEIYSLGSE